MNSGVASAKILAALLVITLFSWWWSSRPKRAPREPEPVPIHKQQAKFLKTARKAALAADAATVRSALIDWGSLQWPDEPPRSIGTIASVCRTAIRRTAGAVEA